MTEEVTEFEVASQQAEKVILERIESGKANAVDYLNLAKIYYLLRDISSTQKVARMGLKVVGLAEDKDSEEMINAKKTLARILSESLRFEYHQTMRPGSNGEITVNLQLLDEALTVDPTNPNAISDVAQLVVQGREATPAMVDKLQRSLTEGSASLLVCIGAVLF